MATQTHMALTQRLGLTPAQRRCLDAIEAYIAQHRCAPTYEDLRHALGLSSKGVVAHLLGELVGRGYITKAAFKERSIEIVAHPQGFGRPEFAWTLPPKTEAALHAHCKRTGEQPGDVVADAVALFLDQVEADAA